MNCSAQIETKYRFPNIYEVSGNCLYRPLSSITNRIDTQYSYIWARLIPPLTHTHTRTCICGTRTHTSETPRFVCDYKDKWLAPPPTAPTTTTITIFPEKKTSFKALHCAAEKICKKTEYMALDCSCLPLSKDMFAFSLLALVIEMCPVKGSMIS